MARENFRDRKFCLLLYPDDETHVKAMEKLKKVYDYAYILHDKDIVEETGELKKPHWHVVIDIGENARWHTAIASELGINENYIQQCRNKDRALMYLIHFNDKDKIQYSIDKVQGTLKKRLKLALAKDDKTEQEKMQILLNIILEQTIELRYTDLVQIALELGYYDVVRRSPMIFKNLIVEKNDELKAIRTVKSSQEGWYMFDFD